MATNFRNKSASQHNFAMIPRADIPRSKYLLQKQDKTTFDASYLIPIYCEEMLPGDKFNGEATIYARFATPIVPVLDDCELETHYFAVPLRLLWENFEAFMAGESFLIPQLDNVGGVESPVGGIYDQFGLVTEEMVTAVIEGVSALPLRAYNRIFKDWFMDQNLTTEPPIHTGDGPDDPIDYTLLKRAKKHDYFTGCLPWPQKGTAVSMPLGTTAPVVSTQDPPTFMATGVTWPGPSNQSTLGAGSSPAANPFWAFGNASGSSSPVFFGTETGLETDLTNATAATINTIRTAFQVQKYLERMARGGSRYTEIIQSQFGVHPQDFRLNRPEYIGGGRTAVNTHPIAQTSSTDATTPQGNLAAFTTAHGGGHRFSYAALEHCYIIGICSVRCNLTYQQGIRRHWWRSTNLDFYTPVFAHLGEQAVLSREIFANGTAGDNDVFGYQERWAEYRYTPNEIKGYFRSTVPTTIDIWHYSEKFATRPQLNNTFIEDPSQAVLSRSMAVGAEADGQQVLLDILHRVVATRPMPTYSQPGLIDHF